MVKQPSQYDIDSGITHCKAREAEECFFDQQQPWAGKFSAYRKRFGTKNLQAALSNRLATLSSQALPTIRDRIRKQLHELEARLATIPRPPTQGATGIVRDKLKDFTRDVRKEMRSKVATDSWRVTWDRLRKDLDISLQSLAPRLNLKGDLDRSSFKIDGPNTIDLCSEDEDSPCRPSSLPLTPQKRKIGPATPPQAFPGLTNAGAGSVTKKPKIEPSNDAVRYTLDGIRVRLYEMSSAKLAHQVNPKAIENLVSFLDTIQAP